MPGTRNSECGARECLKVGSQKNMSDWQRVYHWKHLALNPQSQPMNPTHQGAGGVLLWEKGTSPTWVNPGKCTASITWTSPSIHCHFLSPSIHCRFLSPSIHRHFPCHRPCPFPLSTARASIIGRETLPCLAQYQIGLSYRRTHLITR